MKRRKTFGDLEFRDGFPRIVVAGYAEALKQKVNIEGRAMLAHTLERDGINLRVHCLGLAPKAEGVTLPVWAATIADAAATKAVNDVLNAMPIRMPIASQLRIAFEQPAPIEQWVKTNNGRVLIRITLPEVQPTVLHIQPRAVFFSKDGLHLVANLLTKAPDALAGPMAPTAAQGADLAARLQPWRIEAGRDVRARAGSGAILDLLNSVNQWPEKGRTLSFRGVQEEGHLMDKTGGAPFGNGFGAWLEGPERLQGTVLLQQITPAWQPDKQRLTLTARVAAEGRVQVHVHGNAPRIPPPKLFGLKIGGGVKLGGGAGTSIGARVPLQERTVTGAMQWDSIGRAFEVRLVEPGELNFKIDIVGVPDELEKLFKLGFKIPLPRDQALYRFKIPPLIEGTVHVPLPGDAGGGNRAVRISAEEPTTNLVPEGLEFSSRLLVE